MDNEKRTGIEISQKSANQQISMVGGGIKIAASEKPIAANFSVNWGRVYILLDCSRSMKGKKLEQAKLGITKFAGDAFKKEYLVGLIRFSDEAELISEPTHDIAILQDKMKGLQASGGTNMTDAITLTHSKLKGFKSTRVMVIATDGEPDNGKTSLQAAELAKADGIDILNIGTEKADKEFLKKLASRAELATKVSNDMFAQAISDASLLLMSPKSIKPI